MRHANRIASLGLAALLVVACGGRQASTGLELSFLSGHRGDYSGCPAQAGDFAFPEPGGEADKREPFPRDPDGGGVAPQDPPQPPPPACVNARVVVSLANSLGATLPLPFVEQLQVLREGASPKKATVLNVLQLGAATTELASGASTDFEITFAGPSTQQVPSAVRLELTLRADADHAASLVTPALGSP